MIYGEKVRLRADERSDIPLFVQWLNDPEVREHLSMYLPVSLAGEEQWFENMLKLPVNEQPLAIEVHAALPAAGVIPADARDGWKLIGNCGFMDINWRIRSAEVGLLIGDKTCWGKGHGTEVMRLLLRHGFETLNLNRIFLRVDETNQRGVHVYEKVGFVQEGRFRQAVYLNGKYQDLLVMSVLRPEWNKLDKR
jgi:RimJ/RimL family protein N-acetyltransferase